MSQYPNSQFLSRYWSPTNNSAAEGLKVAEDVTNPDLLTTMKHLQTYFSGLRVKFWQGTASTTAN